MNFLVGLWAFCVGVVLAVPSKYGLRPRSVTESVAAPGKGALVPSLRKQCALDGDYHNVGGVSSVVNSMLDVRKPVRMCVGHHSQVEFADFALRPQLKCSKPPDSANSFCLAVPGAYLRQNFRKCDCWKHPVSCIRRLSFQQQTFLRLPNFHPKHSTIFPSLSSENGDQWASPWCEFSKLHKHGSTMKLDGWVGGVEGIPSKNPVEPTQHIRNCDSVGAWQGVDSFSKDVPDEESRPPRGFRDFPPDSFGDHKFIFNLWKAVAGDFGFREYKVPAVEHAGIFVTPGRPEREVSKDGHELNAPPHIYRLQNKGTEELCLRPEITPTLVRMVLREYQYNPTKFPRRWYCIERVWRHERPCRGRRREHFQWNLDITVPMVGGGHSNINKRDVNYPAGFEVSACAELIAASVALFQKLGLTSKDVQVRIGSRRVVSDILNAYTTERECSLGHANSPKKPSSSNGIVGSFAGTPVIDTGTPRENLKFDDPTVKAIELHTVLQAIDRADRREEAETTSIISNALRISPTEAVDLLHRLRYFDVYDFHSMQWLLRMIQKCSVPPSWETEGFEATPVAPGVVATMEKRLPSSIKDLCYLMEILYQSYGLQDWVKIDLSIVRGLNYYTGLVFEAFDTEKRFRALLGGGVYFHPTRPVQKCASGRCGTKTSGKSHLPSPMNETEGVAGVGLGMGDCVLLELLRAKNMLQAIKDEVDIIVVQASFQGGRSDSDAVDNNTKVGVPLTLMAHRLCSTLRSAGLRSEFVGDGQRNRRAVLKYAETRGAKAVLFVERPISAVPAAKESTTTEPSNTARVSYRVKFLKQSDPPENYHKDASNVFTPSIQQQVRDKFSASTTATGEIRTVDDANHLCSFLRKCICTSQHKCLSA